MECATLTCASDERRLAQQLAATAGDQVATFLQKHSAQLDSRVAWELKAIFDALESSDPAGAVEIARLLDRLSDHRKDAECIALAAWTRGMANQLEGDLATSLINLSFAEETFLQQEQPIHAASTLISKLISLAMLGHYDEAVRTGLRARAVFLTHNDLLSAGKIEQNLGNIYFRRDEYRKAEQIYRTARKRFLALNDAKQLAQIDNCLASALTWQHKFVEALDFYEQALARAEAEDLLVTQAEIESNLGGLMLFQGRYDRALDYLERARRRYASLGLPHDAAISEKELAEAYLELNLIPEALAIFARLLPTFKTLGMQADLASSFTSFARACISTQRYQEAQSALTTARSIYHEEKNFVGGALTLLVEAQRLIATQQYQQAIIVASQCEPTFAQGNAWEWLLRTRTLHAEALHRLGDRQSAETLFTNVLEEARQRELPQIELHCLSALGSLALSNGDHGMAEWWLRNGLAKFETLRALLPSEEFRISYRGDQTNLFEGLITLALADGRIEEALQLIERARSHTLLELVDGNLSLAFEQRTVEPRDAFESELLQQLAERRAELNWFYHQLHRLPTSEEQPSGETITRLHQAANQREQAIAEIVRQLQQRNDQGQLSIDGIQPLQLGELQKQLGSDSAIIEYYSLHGQLLAFVITDQAIHLVDHLLPEADAERLIRQLRFQLDTLRNGNQQIRRHMPQLIERCNHYLRQLYTLLIHPVAAIVAQRRLVIVPYGALHYIPFQALCTENQYLIERTEICVAPSASVLLHCLQQKRSRQQNDSQTQQAVLIGAADEQTPHLAQEIAALHTLFPTAQVRTGEAATLEAVRTLAPSATLLHLACHGHFRPDNPLFSALRLADGLLTVRDTYALRLNCSLVTLSACETGINAISPGDELLGLVRGFLAAGAPSLLVSLWPVDDATTVQFMRHFYQALLAGNGLAQAQRSAQRMLIASSPHPFYWSPFVLFGCWD